MKLYELTDEMIQLMEMLADGEDPEVIRDTMESLNYEIEAKADGYAKIIRNLTGDIAAIDAEIERLNKAKKAKENSIGWLKQNLEDSMIRLGKEKFKTQLFSFGIQNNPPKLIIDDPTGIPKEFLIPQEPKVDNAKIKDLIKNSPVNWAHLEQGRSLRIR